MIGYFESRLDESETVTIMIELKKYLISKSDDVNAQLDESKLPCSEESRYYKSDPEIDTHKSILHMPFIFGNDNGKAIWAACIRDTGYIRNISIIGPS